MSTGPGGGFTVEAFEQNRFLLLVIRERLATITTSWMLDPLEGGRTRLVLRIRARFDFAVFWTRLYYPIFEPGDFIMLRNMLLGIKERAEHGTRRELP